MVLLMTMMVAPISSWAQGAQTSDQATRQATELTASKGQEQAAATAIQDSLAQDSIFAASLGDEALTAAFDSLENMFSGGEYVDFYDLPPDTVRLTPAPGNVLTDKDKQMLEAASRHKIFIPDPQRALWLSFVIPGGGQIYNRKYWKLPIFYGGFLGCMYAFTWNQQMYMDYSQAYLDIMDDNPNTNSYVDMFPPSYDIDSNISRFQTVFKNRKDRYRRWRDLSAFCFIGVYALSIIDAYVDAHLSVFDISPDLSLQWGPTSVEGPHPNLGVGATLSF